MGSPPRAASPSCNTASCARCSSGARASAVHTALDTAGCVSWPVFEDLLAVTDLVLLDVKTMDSDVHQRWTGVPNELILENARHLARAEVDVIVRIPVVPGVNDGAENLRRTAELLADFPRLRGVELLPYHDLGVGKMHVLQRPDGQQRLSAPDPADLARLSSFFSSRGFDVLTR